MVTTTRIFVVVPAVDGGVYSTFKLLFVLSALMVITEVDILASVNDPISVGVPISDIVLDCRLMPTKYVAIYVSPTLHVPFPTVFTLAIICSLNAHDLLLLDTPLKIALPGFVTSVIVVPVMDWYIL